MTQTSQLTPLRPYAALLIKRGTEKILIVADLHIGWEVALAEEGVHVPSQTPKLLKRLSHLVESYKPTRLIILGDVKHTIAKIEMEEWRDIPAFFEQLSRIIPKVQVIPGNHDGNLEPLLPENIEILPANGEILFDTGLFHGHTWPNPELLKCKNLIIGHVHPVVVFRDPIGFRITRQVWVKARCDASKLAKFVLRYADIKVKEELLCEVKVSSLLIMPSFNDFLGGQAVNRRNIGRGSKFKQFIGPVLRSGSVHIGEAEVYLLDGTFLGTINQLRTLGQRQR